MDRISDYREIRVLVYPGEGMARVQCVCRAVRGGERRDRAVIPGGGLEVPIGPTDALPDILRAAGRALEAVSHSL